MKVFQQILLIACLSGAASNDREYEAGTRIMAEHGFFMCYTTAVLACATASLAFAAEIIADINLDSRNDTFRIWAIVAIASGSISSLLGFFGPIWIDELGCTVGCCPLVFLIQSCFSNDQCIAQYSWMINVFLKSSGFLPIIANGLTLGGVISDSFPLRMSIMIYGFCAVGFWASIFTVAAHHSHSKELSERRNLIQAV